MRMMLLPAAVALLAAGAACSPEQPQDQDTVFNPNRARILENVPRVPGSLIRDTTGTAEAERAVYFVGASLDSLTRFFRDTLPKLGWELVNQNGDSTVMDLYFSRDSASLWIHAEPLPRVSLTNYLMLASGKIEPGTPLDSGKAPRN